MPESISDLENWFSEHHGGWKAMRTILDTIDALVIVIDKQGNLVLFNQACSNLTGYEFKEVQGRPFYELLLIPEEVEAVRALFDKLNAGLFPNRHENYWVTKNGDRRWIDWSNTALTDDDGEVVYVVGTGLDLTQRRLAEQEVLQSEKEVRIKNAVLDSVNTVLLETLTCETDKEVAQVCLEAAVKMTGSRFGFIGEINQDGRFDTIALSNPGWEACLVPETDAVKAINNMELRGLWSAVIKDKQSIIANDPSSHPASVGLPQGHPALTSFLGTPLKHGGRTFGMCALANKEGEYVDSDVSSMKALSVAFVQALNRKRAEHRFLEERKQLLSIFDGITEVVYVADPATYEILFMNQALKQVFGEAQGQVCYEVFQNKSSPCEFCTNDIIFKSKTGQAHIWEFYNTVAGRWFRCVDKAIRWPDGRRVRYEMAIDITDIKEAEEAIRRSAISRQLVGEMFRDLQKHSSLRDGDMFKAGSELAGRVNSAGIDEYLDTFSAMGMGALSLHSMEEDGRRWVFIGDKLMEGVTHSVKPTGHYTRGFLCGAVSRVTGAPKVACVETNCQSMGDDCCRFIVQVLK